MTDIKRYISEIKIFQRVMQRLDEVDDRFKITILRGGLNFRVMVESERSTYYITSTPVADFDFRITKENDDLFVRQDEVSELTRVVNDLD